MRAPLNAATLLLLRHSLSTLRPPQNFPIIQVIPSFSLYLSYLQLSTNLTQLPSKSNNPHSNLSSINFNLIKESILVKNPHLREKKIEFFPKPSLKDCILRLSTINPEIIRKFRRVRDLKPEDVLEILVGFEPKCEEIEVDVEKVKSLWGLFNLASENTRGFEHLPTSYKLMADMLVRVGFLREIEYLSFTMDSKGILLDSDEIFSNLVIGYVKKGEIEKAISIYDGMKTRGLVPSAPCYNVLINLLIEKGDTHLAFRTYMDMVEMGLGLMGDETGVFENVVLLLCRDGRVQEARNLVKRVILSGTRPSDLVIDKIASLYCEKKDYDDLLKFFAETRCELNVLLGNKTIHSLCSSFGVERASLFLHEMENVGFIPNEITYGILIGWSCHERKLKNAFIYLSDILSRSLKPHVHSYNALISGVFREGMWKHARDILYEMNDRGVRPNYETFKVFLAGYSKARRFDEVKELISEMVGCGFVHLSSLEDPLSKAFSFLGLDPLSVKLRRDNNVENLKTEFFDKIGNGLYLETDIIKFEKVMDGVLENSLLPDFNSFVLKNCGEGNFRNAIIIVKEMVKWGQELSFSAFTELVKGLSTSRLSMKTVVSLVEKRPSFTNHLDQGTLNLLIQTLSKNRFLNKAINIFECMSKRNLGINSETYDAFITGLCKKRNLRSFLTYMNFARLNKWSPQPEDCKSIFRYLSEKGFVNEALELFENSFLANPSKRLQICHDLLESLCSKGFTCIAHALVEELQNQGFVLDHISYSYLVEGFFKEKMRGKAFLVLELLLEKNMVPCLDVIKLSVSQFCQDNQLKKAIILKDVVLREQPSSLICVFSSLIGGFCLSGEVEVAENIVRDMLLKGFRPHSEIYNMLVCGYCQDNNLRRVWEILCFMIRKNSRISIPSYRNLICLMCSSGRVQFALNTKELLLNGKNPPYLSIYNILIFYLFRTGNSLFVDALLGKVLEKEFHYDEVTYNFLICGYCRCGDVAQSLKHLKAMLSTQYQPNNRSLRTVISCLCSIGEIEKALDLSKEMELRGWAHDSATQMAIFEGLLSQNKLEQAIRFLDRMTEKARVDDNINYDNVIKQLCRYENNDKAIELLNIMLKKANIPSLSTYNELIQCSCKRFKLDQALDLLYEMLDLSLVPSTKTWDVIIYHVCEKGRTIEGETLFNMMIESGEKPTREIYCSLIDRYYHEKNLNKASEYVQKMQQSGYEPNFDTHWSLISNLKNKSDENSDKNKRSFLSRLLSDSGFALKKDFKASRHFSNLKIVAELEHPMSTFSFEIFSVSDRIP